MKKLLMSGIVAVLCSGAPMVYADDAHHPDQAGAPAAKAAPGKTAPAGKKPAASKKPVGDAGGCGITDEQMGKAQERMKQAQALMIKLREAKDPAERQRLMQEHTQAMRDTMDMMHGMKMGSGMGMMSQGKGQAGGMMNMHQMMEERMEMMQMMMEQMFERQEMLMRDGK